MSEIPVLDHGFVKLLGHMGNDSTIVESARISTNQSTKTPEQDARLIRYMLREGHWSPFEMVEFRFHLKLPIFVFRQLVRHRTASVNEMSARYVEMKEEFYIPSIEDMRGQHGQDKQAGGAALDVKKARWAQDWMTSSVETAYDTYKALLEEGVARELARIVLPVNLYTEVIWKQDLRNLLHLLDLRLDWHAQLECRRYAEAMLELITPVVPVTVAAWRELKNEAS